MKRILFSFSLMLLACNSFAQKGFGIDGTIGAGQNGGDLVYPLLLEGRIQFNDYLSANLGLGLWNSGFKSSWREKDATTATEYSISSNKTLPSLQLGARAQFPVIRYREKPVRLFVEPKLYFLAYSRQSVDLQEKYFTIKTDNTGGNTQYVPTGKVGSGSLTSASSLGFSGGCQLGFAYEIVENIDLAISYGYSNLDLFKDLRGQTITDQSSRSRSLDTFLPRKNLQQIQVSFLVNFNLN